MKKNIVLSFDDGRLDFYDTVFPILKKYHFKSTLNVVTGYSDGSFPPPYNVCNVLQLQDLYKSSLVELAIHGNEHLRKETPEDFELCFFKIKEWCGCEPSGVAMPFNQYPTKRLIAWCRGKGLSYIRIGQLPSKKNLFLFLRKILGLERPSFLKNSLYSIKANSRIKRLTFFYSVPIEKDRDIKDYFQLFKRMRPGLTCVLMFHSIGKSVLSEKKSDFALGAWDEKKFESLMSFFKKNEFEFEIKFQREVTQ